MINNELFMDYIESAALFAEDILGMLKGNFELVAHMKPCIAVISRPTLLRSILKTSNLIIVFLDIFL